MSQENVEIVRGAYEAMNKRDYTAFFASVDPEVEFVLPEGGMNAGTHRGHRAVRQFMEGYDESFENFQVVPESSSRRATRSSRSSDSLGGDAKAASRSRPRQSTS